MEKAKYKNKGFAPDTAVIKSLNLYMLLSRQKEIRDVLTNIKYLSPRLALKIVFKVFFKLAKFKTYSFLVFDKDRVVGVLFGKPFKNLVFGKAACEIKYLSVGPEYKGVGVANKLVEKFESRCLSRFSYAYLTVYENNLRAIVFYKKQGFEEYILNGELQTVLFDRGTASEHIDICMVKKI